jgi:hypothetical protein
LTLPGTVTVAVGDTVAARDVVARAEQPGDLVVLRIAEQLGIEPHEVVEGLSVSVGQSIVTGAVVCEHVGLFGLLRSRFTSPVTGTVELITPRTGHVAVRLAPKTVELRAYVEGRVVEVTPGKSLTIETDGAFIQGIFGVGGERNGRMWVLPIGLGDELHERHLVDDLNGAIVVGGTRPSGAALRRAADLGAVGLIVGSIDDEALAEYLGYDLGVALTGDESVPMTVIVTEGFGRIPMAERTYAILKSLHGLPASINGATQVRAGAIRPEIIVARPDGGERVDSPPLGLDVGARIRIIRVPYFGAQGTIVDLPAAAQEIETGAMTRVLIARLDDGRTVTVPRANIELEVGA